MLGIGTNAATNGRGPGILQYGTGEHAEHRTGECTDYGKQDAGVGNICAAHLIL